MADTNDDSTGQLRLGWGVSEGGDPIYWLKPGARAGAQTDEDMVVVPVEQMATHSVIVAQSGSGKSFFLGRLIEELLLKSRSRCLIPDSNGDFWRVHETCDSSQWERAGYDLHRQVGWLPDEASALDFEEKWAEVKISIESERYPWGGDLLSDCYKGLKTSWESISAEAFADELGPVQRSQFTVCHSFLQAVAKVVACAKEMGIGTMGLDIRTVCEAILSSARTSAAARRLGEFLAQPAQADAAVLQD